MFIWKIIIFECFSIKNPRDGSPDSDLLCSRPGVGRRDGLVLRRVSGQDPRPVGAEPDPGGEVVGCQQEYRWGFDPCVVAVKTYINIHTLLICTYNQNVSVFKLT